MIRYYSFAAIRAETALLHLFWGQEQAKERRIVTKNKTREERKNRLNDNHSFLFRAICSVSGCYFTAAPFTEPSSQSQGLLCGAKHKGRRYLRFQHNRRYWKSFLMTPQMESQKHTKGRAMRQCLCMTKIDVLEWGKRWFRAIEGVDWNESY